MISERITTWIAAGAVASPWWLPTLAEVSTFASLLLPILGAAWLGVQITSKLREWRKDKRP